MRLILILSTVLLITGTGGVFARQEVGDDGKFKCGGVCKDIPEGCNTINCKLGTRLELVKKGDTTLNVHAGAEVADANGYVAVGLSKDAQMGDDIVIMCIPEKNVTVMINVPHKDPVDAKLKQNVTGNTLYEKGRIDCSFILPLQIGTADDRLKFDLSKDKFFVLVATGKLNPTGGPVNHGPGNHRAGQIMGADFLKAKKSNGVFSSNGNLFLVAFTAFLVFSISAHKSIG